MSILEASAENIEKAAGVLRSGGVAAFPTETVYGLGVDARSPAACARVFEIKKRPFFDPLIVHIANLAGLSELARLERLSPHCAALLPRITENFMPGPLTLVLPKRDSVPSIVSAGLATVAVRMPRNKIALKLIERAGGAVAAPSANLFGRISPTKAEHVAAQFDDSLLILDGGSCEIGLESTVLDLTGDIPAVLRPGGASIEDLRRVLGRVLFGNAGNNESADNSAQNAKKSPGMEKKHYAPRTPLYLHTSAELETLRLPPSSAVLRLESTLVESAARLFDKLHALDNGAFLEIHAETAPEEGLGFAINDRLRRASYRRC